MRDQELYFLFERLEPRSYDVKNKVYENMVLDRKDTYYLLSSPSEQVVTRNPDKVEDRHHL